MGGWARADPAGQGPLARGAFDRPSQRRHVSLVPGADPAADGPRVPRRAPQGRESKAAGGERTARWIDAGVHPGRDRDRHTRRPGAAARALAKGTSRPRRGRRRDGVRAGCRPGEDVRGTALRDQSWSRRGGRGPAAPGARRSAARRAPRLRHRGDKGREAVLRRLRDGRLRELRGGAVKINDVTIEDTFAEAFTMRVARLVITGRTLGWAREAAVKLTGVATSVIGCKCEAGIERELPARETAGGRAGASGHFSARDKARAPA